MEALLLSQPLAGVAAPFFPHRRRPSTYPTFLATPKPKVISVWASCANGSNDHPWNEREHEDRSEGKPPPVSEVEVSLRVDAEVVDWVARRGGRCARRWRCEPRGGGSAGAARRSGSPWPPSRRASPTPRSPPAGTRPGRARSWGSARYAATAPRSRPRRHGCPRRWTGWRWTASSSSRSARGSRSSSERPS